MRLIAGFLHLDGRPAEEARLYAMAAAMTEPGLDPRVNIRIDGPVGLLTLDFGPAPDFRASAPRDERLLLAADIRLDEPEALRDPIVREAGLTQLLAAHGSAALPQLAGDFAFAAWNRQDRTLLCARDGLGIRPFFFAHRPDRQFLFASLPRGLHASGLVSRSLDRASLVNELLFRFDGPERSLFDGVGRLAPGGWLSLGPGVPVKAGQHWSPDAASAGSRNISPEDAATELSRLVKSAVCNRLPPTGPVATHLSGGMDSSAIAIVAARALRPSGRKLLAYSHAPAAFGPYSFGGNGPWLAPVLDQEPDIVWRAVRTGDPAALVLPAMDCDQPFPTDVSHRESRSFGDAASSGASLLLSGWGGDEAASYGWRGVLAEALVTGNWYYLAAELRALGSAGAAWGALSPFLLGGRTLALVHRLAGRAPPPPGVAHLAASLLRPEHVAGHSLVQTAMPPDARRIRVSLLRGHGLTRRMEQWALLGARHGIGVGFPLLDRRVVEFALSLPSRLFVRDGWSRRLFRDAMDGILPEALRWKTGKEDLVVEDPLYVAAQRALLTERLEGWRERGAIADLFDLDAVSARLASLPPAHVLARTIDTGRGDWPAVERAGSLMRAFRVMAYIDQHG